MQHRKTLESAVETALRERKSVLESPEMILTEIGSVLVRERKKIRACAAKRNCKNSRGNV